MDHLDEFISYVRRALNAVVLSDGHYDKYLALASELQLAGYQQSRIFERSELEVNLRFAEDLLTKVKSTVSQ